MLKPIDLYPMMIDNRIGAVELEPHVNSGVNIQLTRLEYADVSFYGNGPDGLVNIGIERKRITDLLSSIESGRLSGHQLIGLLNSYNYVYLLVEGLWQSNPRTGMLEIYKGRKWRTYDHGRAHTGAEINNYLNTLAVKCGVRIWRTATIQQSGRWLSDLYLWWQKSWDRHTAHRQVHVEPEPVAQLVQPSPMQSMLKAGIKNLGWKKARLVAEHYPNMLDLAMATKKELTKLQGIGKIQADKILKIVRGE